MVGRTRDGINRLFAWNRLRWPVRLPLKWAIFSLVAALVCFPYPHLLARHVRHWRNPDALIEPNAPELQPLWEKLQPQVPDDLPPKEALRRVERFVYETIPYEWDWNTWGIADYLPTVAEVIRMGKEDCDGRAVVAASLLRRLGFDAQLVTDFAHVWVRTERGDTMGPGHRQVLVATPQGPRVHWLALVELPGALAYGVAVFPWPRELILIGVTWLLLVEPRRRAGPQIGGLVLLLVALACLRWGGRDYRHPVCWLQWSGHACTVMGFYVLLIATKRRARIAEDGKPRETGADSARHGEGD